MELFKLCSRPTPGVGGSEGLAAICLRLGRSSSRKLVTESTAPLLVRWAVNGGSAWLNTLRSAGVHVWNRPGA